MDEETIVFVDTLVKSASNFFDMTVTSKKGN